MDIGLASMSISTANVDTGVGLIMMKKQLNAAESEGAAVVDMMQSASLDPNLGQNVNTIA